MTTTTTVSGGAMRLGSSALRAAPLSILRARRFWSSAVILAAALLFAYLAVGIVTTLASPGIPPQMHLETATSEVLPAHRPGLDASKLARAMGPPTKSHSDPVGFALQKQGSAAPARSALRFALVSTAVARPERYSLCQLRSTDTNATGVYGIGDRLMGWRIYAIAKDRVLIEREGRSEYIDSGASSPAPAASLDKYSPALDPYWGQVDPPTPHG
jgi:hypothetical protein